MSPFINLSLVYQSVWILCEARQLEVLSSWSKSRIYEPTLGEEHQWRSQASSGCPRSLEYRIGIMQVFYDVYNVMHVIYVIILQLTRFVIFPLHILIYEINLFQYYAQKPNMSMISLLYFVHLGNPKVDVTFVYENVVCRDTWCHWWN